MQRVNMVTINGIKQIWKRDLHFCSFMYPSLVIVYNVWPWMRGLLVFKCMEVLFLASFCIFKICEIIWFFIFILFFVVVVWVYRLSKSYFVFISKYNVIIIILSRAEPFLFFQCNIYMYIYQKWGGGYPNLGLS